MNFSLTKEQQGVQTFTRDFAKEKITPFVAEMEEKDRFPRMLINEMAQAGLMGIPVSKQYGGRGCGFVSYILAVEEISKVSATVGVILSVHTSVGTYPILSFGSNRQKQAYVPKLARGEYLGAFALTEPSAGSDAANLRTLAVKKNDHYLINGSKLFITNGGEANTYIVFALTERAKGDRRISAFIVDQDTAGFHIGKKENKMGLHGSSTAELSFEDMQVPAEQLLGQEGEGFKIALANLAAGRIGIAAQALGIAEAAFETTLNCVKQHDSVRAQQGMSFILADMATNIEAARLLTYQAASLREKGLACKKEASIAKLYASQIAMEVTTKALELVGLSGSTKDCALERYFRDAKVTQIYEGTSEIQRLVIMKQLVEKKTKK